MCTFVPNGNKPIKPNDEEDSKKAPPAQTPIKEKRSLNQLPGWKSSHDDEFVVDL